MTTQTQVASSLPIALPRAPARVVALFGVPLAVDVWALLGGALAAWTIADGALPAAAPGHVLGAYSAAATGAAVLLLVSLALHEAAHAVVARHAGLGITRAVLSFGGGATVLRDEPRTPGDAFRIAMAGPLASLACATIAGAVHVALVERGADSLGAGVAAIVASGNVVIAAINLVPGLPLDGGHALQAVVWAWTGRKDVASSAARTAGRAVGAVVVAMALIVSASGDAALAVWLGYLGLAIAGSRR